MAILNDRYSRSSAMHLLVPYMHGAHTDTTSGVSARERLSVTWMYNGIPVSILFIAVTLQGADAFLGALNIVTAILRQPIVTTADAIISTLSAVTLQGPDVMSGNIHLVAAVLREPVLADDVEIEAVSTVTLQGFDVLTGKFILIPGSLRRPS